MAVLLDVKNLRTQFQTDSGLVKAVDGVSYHIDESEIVGLVGESGCGKSVSQLSVLQLIPSPPGKIVDGEILFEGRDLRTMEANGPEIRRIRGGRISMIFQEPMTSLNPVMTIGNQIGEMVELHLGMDGQAARRRSVELLKMVGIPGAESRVDDYPHQFSGGMRQRVMIAIALSCNPRMVIADEPTTALDVTMQALLLETMTEMVKQFNASLVIVTHNLGVVARYAHRIHVMYAGRIVEAGTTKAIFGNPRHPYTIGLLNAVPRLDEKKGRRLLPIIGMPPNLINMPPTCAFLPRCPYSLDRCRTDVWPELSSAGDEHFVSCYASEQRIKEPPVHPSVYVMPEANFLATAVAAASSSTPTPTDDAVVEVKDLKMYFPLIRGVMQKKVGDVKALDGVSFTISRGETLGLVGETGCGKTTTGRCVLRLYKPTSGQIKFEGTDITTMPERKLKPIRRKMSLIFQDPSDSLDPRQSAGSIVGEPLTVHHVVSGRSEHRDRVEYLFRLVGLDPCMQDRVPHEFSGGQRQRLAVARALASEPSLIVCDEPISALDVSIQAQIINLLQELKEGLKGLTYLFVAHDLSVVRHISDRIAVMYLGRIVELAEASALYGNPQHSYTKALLSAVPIPDPFVEERRSRIMLKGEIPSPLDPPDGCGFHPRCPNSTRVCELEVPGLCDTGEGHLVACHRFS